MAVDAVVSLVAGKLGDLLFEEAKLLYEVRDDFEWIKAELQGMVCFLRDADEKQGDARVKNWIAEIRDVAYDAEDIIDTLILRKEQKKNNNRMKRYMSIFGDLKARYEIGDDIRRIRTKLGEISKRRLNFGIENLASIGEASSYAVKRLQKKRRSSPHSDESDVIGLEDDSKRLISRLVENDLTRRVISIVGMGGLGKTTLAKKVYNSKAAMDHFQCRVWIYVSQVYSARGLLKDIWKKVVFAGNNLELLEDGWNKVSGFSGDNLTAGRMDDRWRKFTGSSEGNLTVEQMVEMISVVLLKNRYLVVMDDVWDVDAWNYVKAAFPVSENGSRVLLTTRNREVAIQADNRSPPHEPKLLSDENSWVLMLNKVGIEESECPPYLEEVGRRIVKKCGGLPLAIVLLGGVLSSKEASYNAWSRVLECVSWQLEQDDTPCSKILALSYIDLPRYLKPCFIYFGLFPEDYEIYLRRLKGLWLAEGLVQHRDHEPLEDVAEDYIDELIDRSMIQVASRKPEGKIKTCRMHDLLRDLALKRGKEANFLHIYENKGSTLMDNVKIRRLAVHDRINQCPSICPSSINHIRSYLAVKQSQLYLDGQSVLKFLKIGIQEKCFMLIRVLDLEQVSTPGLPEALGELIHLRYLGLRHAISGRLPSSLGNLRNLQTLDVKFSGISVSHHPIWALQQLRHLYMTGGCDCKIMRQPVSSSSSSFSLKNLRTLSGVYIDRETLVEDGLDNSVHLKKLKVCGDLASQGESLSNWFVKLDRLEVLKLNPSAGHAPHRLPTKLRFSYNKHLYRLHMGGIFPEKFLEVNEFPPNLTVLTFHNCRMEEDPFPTLEKLQNLRTLTLSRNSYTGKELVCSCGGFQQLQLLKLCGLEELETCKMEYGAMRNLKILWLQACSELKRIPDGLQHITALQELKLQCMPEQLTTRIRPSDGVDWYKIRHIPSRDIQ